MLFCFSLVFPPCLPACLLRNRWRRVVVDNHHHCGCVAAHWRLGVADVQAPHPPQKDSRHEAPRDTTRQCGACGAAGITGGLQAVQGTRRRREPRRCRESAAFGCRRVAGMRKWHEQAKQYKTKHTTEMGRSIDLHGGARHLCAHVGCDVRVNQSSQ